VEKVKLFPFLEDSVGVYVAFGLKKNHFTFC